MQEALMGELQDVVGSYCELRSMLNVLERVGRITSVDDGTITISSEDSEMPQVIYNTEFKVIIRPTGKSSVTLFGKVCGSSRSFWKLDGLTRFYYQENRAYFRQPVSATASVVCINGLFCEPQQGEDPVVYAKRCRVSDISLEGVQIRGRDLSYNTGDWLLLSDLSLLQATEHYHTLICRVCRSEKVGRDELLFGCHFQFMNEQEQDELCSDIFALQRQDIQARRLW